METMLKYDDCGLRNIWLANGYRYEEIDGHGRCLEIDDIEGLHRSIAHQLVHYRKRLSGAEIRFLRVEMGMSQKRLADSLETHLDLGHLAACFGPGAAFDALATAAGLLDRSPAHL